MVAVTIDHNLTPPSENIASIAESVRLLGTGIEHVVRRIEWPDNKQPATALLQTLRTRRFEMLAEVVREHKATALFVGSNRNDQIETFIHRLQYGSGVEGLACMSHIAPSTGNIQVYRPLLDFAKDELFGLCTLYNIPFTHDRANDLVSYERNRIRLALKQIETEIPDVMFLQTMKVFRELKSEFRTQVNAFLATHADTSLNKQVPLFSIPLAAFANVPDAIGCRIFYCLVMVLHGSYTTFTHTEFAKLYTAVMHHGATKSLKHSIFYTQGRNLHIHPQIRSHLHGGTATYITNASEMYLNNRENIEIAFGRYLVTLTPTVYWPGDPTKHLDAIRFFNPDTDNAYIGGKLRSLKLPKHGKTLIPVLVDQFNQVMCIPHLNLWTMASTSHTPPPHHASIYDPRGNTIYSRLHFDTTMKGRQSFTASEGGAYKLCFNNEMSRFTAKVVTFTWSFEDADTGVLKGDTLSPMENSIQKIERVLQSIVVEQKKMRYREQANRDTSENTNGRVMTYGDDISAAPLLENPEVQAVHQQTLQQFIDLKHANRNVQFGAEALRGEVDKERQKLDKINLLYQNFLYEKNHLLKEIHSLAEYKSPVIHPLSLVLEFHIANEVVSLQFLYVLEINVVTCLVLDQSDQYLSNLFPNDNGEHISPNSSIPHLNILSTPSIAMFDWSLVPGRLFKWVRVLAGLATEDQSDNRWTLVSHILTTIEKRIASKQKLKKQLHALKRQTVNKPPNDYRFAMTLFEELPMNPYSFATLRLVFQNAHVSLPTKPSNNENPNSILLEKETIKNIESDLNSNFNPINDQRLHNSMPLLEQTERLKSVPRQCSSITINSLTFLFVSSDKGLVQCSNSLVDHLKYWGDGEEITKLFLV
eukprot:gene15675-18625_t